MCSMTDGTCPGLRVYSAYFLARVCGAKLVLELMYFVYSCWSCSFCFSMRLLSYDWLASGMRAIRCNRADCITTAVRSSKSSESPVWHKFGCGSLGKSSLLARMKHGSCGRGNKLAMHQRKMLKFPEKWSDWSQRALLEP
jgi:hypothetical protein